MYITTVTTTVIVTQIVIFYCNTALPVLLRIFREFRIEQARVTAMIRKQALEREVCIYTSIRFILKVLCMRYCVVFFLSIFEVVA